MSDPAHPPASAGRPIVECVPNFSEGRDPAVIEQILDAIRAVPGADLVDVDPGKETNRTVVTIVGEPEPVQEAAFQAIASAARVIDMRTHHGAHARHGATDVCPFVPVAGVTMEDCVGYARALGERVGRELEIPVYLYDRAASRPERRSLADVRRGEYEALPEKLQRPEWAPDFGPARFIPETGVVTIGAREFLIAYNVNLNTRAKEHATDIAFEIREAGRIARTAPRTPIYMSGRILRYEPAEHRWPCPYDGHVCASLEELEAHYREEFDLDLREELAFFGQDPERLEGERVYKRGLFRECRAVGWLIPEYGRAQISINLTNFKVTPPHSVLEACRELAAERGIIVTGSEVVGVIPYDAMRECGEFYLQKQGSSRGLPVQDVVETAVQSLGLRDLGEFDTRRSVLGKPGIAGPLVDQSAQEFVHEVSRPSVAPGGGSVSALAGSLAAALASMVANITHAKPKYLEHHETLEEIAVRAQTVKDALLVAVDADTDAFGEVVAALRMPREDSEQRRARDAAIQAGYKSATLVPLGTAERCLEAIELCREAVDLCLPASITDAGVGGLLGLAGVKGAVYNVRINLGEITDRDWVAQTAGRLDELVRRASTLAGEIESRLEARLGE